MVLELECLLEYEQTRCAALGRFSISEIRSDLT